MGVLTREESLESWRRLHSSHPYGSTAQMCHRQKALKGMSGAFEKVGSCDVAGILNVLERLVERRVIITTSVVDRVFQENV